MESVIERISRQSMDFVSSKIVGEPLAVNRSEVDILAKFCYSMFFDPQGIRTLASTREAILEGAMYFRGYELRVID